MACLPAEAGSCAKSASAGEVLWERAEAALRVMHGSSLLIFDWDDTLFPTTVLNGRGNLDYEDDAVCSMNHDVPWEELSECAAAAIEVLRVARTCGNVVIVTNSDHGWVQETSSRYLPALADEMLDIPVISARSIFEPQGVSSPRQRKVLCFERIARCFHSGSVNWGVQSLVSVGDSMDEREATLMVSQFCPCFSKPFKLMERPTIMQIVQQLQVISTHLPLIASHAADLDVDLGQMVALEGILAEHCLEEFVRRARKTKSSEPESMQKRRRLLAQAYKSGA